MSKDRDDERNTGMPGEETFSLEEILAEFGGGAAKPRWKEDTIPFPVTPRSQRTAPSPAGPPGPGKVVSFPAGRREAPPPAPPPQPEPEEPPEDGDKVVEFPGEEGPASDNPIAEGDIAYNPQLQRAACVDIRYTLFIIDKFAGASHLLKEMTIIR